MLQHTEPMDLPPGGRHGGTEGAPDSIPPTPPHDIEHSLYDVGAGEN